VPKNSPDEAIPNFEVYRQLVASVPTIELKGKTTPYTSINGHMFSFLSSKGKIGLHLSPDDRNAFISNHNAKLMVQFGRTMKDYVEIPEHMLSETEVLKQYLEKSYEYVSHLKPKPTKK